MAESNEQLSTKLTQQGAALKPLGLKDYGVQWFKRNEKSLSTLMGTEKEAKRLFLTGLHVASKNPSLLGCEPGSFFAALLRCAELRLYPGPLQEAAIVPFWNSKKRVFEAEFMPQYQGLIKLATNSGHVKNISANIVHQNDFFEFEFGTNAYLKHRPLLTGRGEMLAVYAYAITTQGGEQFSVLSREDVYKLRARSKTWQRDQKEGKRTSVWSQEDIEPWMWKKSAIKQLCKLLPKSPDLAEALEIDDSIDSENGKTSVLDLVSGVDFDSKDDTDGTSEPADSATAP